MADGIDCTHSGNAIRKIGCLTNLTFTKPRRFSKRSLIPSGVILRLLNLQGLVNVESLVLGNYRKNTMVLGKKIVHQQQDWLAVVLTKNDSNMRSNF